MPRGHRVLLISLIHSRRGQEVVLVHGSGPEFHEHARRALGMIQTHTYAVTRGEHVASVAGTDLPICGCTVRHVLPSIRYLSYSRSGFKISSNVP